MAAAWFNALANPESAIAFSAGTDPAEYLHPEVVTVMKEIGIDLSTAHPQLLNESLARQANLLVTMGCGEACPFIPGLAGEDWPLPDPKGQALPIVRGIRDEIGKRIEDLLRRTRIELRADRQVLRH